MLTMNGSTLYSTNRSLYQQQYQSMGDLRSAAAAQQRTSWYDWPPSGTTMTPASASRPLANNGSLSRSMIQLDQPTAFHQPQQRQTQTQYRIASAADYNHMPPTYHNAAGYLGRPANHQSTMMSSSSVADGTTLRRRRRRPMAPASVGGYADDESVFTEPSTWQYQPHQPPRQEIYMPAPPADSRYRPQQLPQQHGQLRQQQQQFYHQPLSQTSSSASHLNAVDAAAASVIDPELKQVGKTGDNYRITMSLNAAMQAESQRRQQHVASSSSEMRDVTAWNGVPLAPPGGGGGSRSLANGYTSLHASRIDLTADNATPVFSPIGDTIASTTVVHVRNDDVGQNETTVVDRRPQPSRRRQLRSVSTSDTGGYRIKSVKSMSDLRDLDDTTSMSATRRRREVVGDDGKVGFDVELQSLGRPALQHAAAVATHRREDYRLLTEEKMKNEEAVIDGNPPKFTMTLNDTMTMEYAPPASDDQWSRQDYFREETKPKKPKLPPRPASVASHHRHRPVNAGTQMSDTETWTRRSRPDAGSSPVRSAAAPKIFSEPPTQTNGTGSSPPPPPRSAAAPKVFSEQATQANVLNSVSTQTNKDRGTQTDKNARPPSAADTLGYNPAVRSSRPNSRPREVDIGIFDGEDDPACRPRGAPWKNGQTPAAGRAEQPGKRDDDLDFLKNSLDFVDGDNPRDSPVTVVVVSDNKAAVDRDFGFGDDDDARRQRGPSPGTLDVLDRYIPVPSARGPNRSVSPRPAANGTAGNDGLRESLDQFDRLLGPDVDVRFETPRRPSSRQGTPEAGARGLSRSPANGTGNDGMLEFIDMFNNSVEPDVKQRLDINAEQRANGSRRTSVTLQRENMPGRGPSPQTLGRRVDHNTNVVSVTVSDKNSPRRTPVDRQNGSSPFGYRGGGERGDYVRLLMDGAPSGSVIQREHREVEEEEVIGPLVGRLDDQGRLLDAGGQDSDALLNLDSVSEKVDLTMANGVAKLIVTVRCEQILPVRDTRDLFRKTSVIVTKVIEVNLMVTDERRQLYDYIVVNQRQSSSGRLSNRDTFDLYQTFMEMARHDEQAGRRPQQQVRIDHQVDEQRLLQLQLNDDLTGRRGPGSRGGEFARVDDKLNAVQSSMDVDVRAQSSMVRTSTRRNQ